MPVLKSSKVTLSGGSARFTLPKSWCKMNRITKNIELQIMEHGVVIIFPPKVDKGLDVEGLIANIRATLTFLKT